MSTTLLRDEDIKTLQKAAALAAGLHSSSAEAMLAEALIECASNPPASNAMGTKQWIAALMSMGEICVSLAKREEKRLRSFSP